MGLPWRLSWRLETGPYPPWWRRRGPRWVARGGSGGTPRDLARRYRHDRKAYTDGKTEFVASVVSAAGIEAS